jgi:hypothetical protein
MVNEILPHLMTLSIEGPEELSDKDIDMIL